MIGCSALLGPAQLLDDGLRQVLIDLVVPWHWLRLLCLGVAIPIVTPAVAYQSTAHILEYLDKFASLHLRDEELFYLADIGHLARFDICQDIF